MLIIYRKRNIEKIMTRGRELVSYPLVLDNIIFQILKDEEMYCVIYEGEKTTWRYVDDIVALEAIINHVKCRESRVMFFMMNRWTHRRIIRKELSLFYIPKRLA